MKKAVTVGAVTHTHTHTHTHYISINHIIYLLRYIGNFDIQINNKGHPLIN